ncbi:MAG: hypothetical protein ABJL99_22760 [Aliishimia sp.]
MQNELRTYYSILRRLFGAYGTLMSVAMITMQPHEAMVSGPWVIVLFTSLIALAVSMVLLVRQLTPKWVAYPRSRHDGLRVMFGVGVAYASLSILNASVLFSLNLGAAQALKIFAASTIPGAIMMVLLIFVIPALREKHRKSSQTYNYFYCPSYHPHF